MTTMHIPDALPALRSGAGGSPPNGGCVIEVAGYLWDGSWTDQAECVHPVLRKVAIAVNDSVDDTERQKLVPLIPRLVGTASDDKHLAVSLAYFSAEYVFDKVREQDRAVCRKALDATKAWLEDPSGENANAANDAANAAYGAASAANDAAYAAYAAAYAANAANASAYAAYGAASAANAKANANAYAAANAANASAYAAYGAASAANDAANAAYGAASAANDAANAANAAYAAYAANANAAARITFLSDLLDEYDRLTGRTPEPITEDRWEALAEVLPA